MASTYELIASQTLESDAAYIEFTSIPATAADLYLLLSLRSTTVDTALSLIFTLNGDTTDGNYSQRNLRGNGSQAISGSTSTRLLGYAPGASMTADTFGNNEIYIPNYAGSTHKSYSTTYAVENNSMTAFTGAFAALWSNTAPITSIKLEAGANLKSASSAYLYGISHS